MPDGKLQDAIYVIIFHCKLEEGLWQWRHWYILEILCTEKVLEDCLFHLKKHNKYLLCKNYMVLKISHLFFLFSKLPTFLITTAIIPCFINRSLSFSKFNLCWPKISLKLKNLKFHFTFMPKFEMTHTHGTTTIQILKFMQFPLKPKRYGCQAWNSCTQCLTHLVFCLGVFRLANYKAQISCNQFLTHLVFCLGAVRLAEARINRNQCLTHLVFCLGAIWLAKAQISCNQCLTHLAFSLRVVRQEQAG